MTALPVFPAAIAATPLVEGVAVPFLAHCPDPFHDDDDDDDERPIGDPDDDDDFDDDDDDDDDDEGLQVRAGRAS